MLQLFIIADDFTGALDTGVQFAAQGAVTRVITDPRADLAAVDEEVNVLVMDAETRHLPPQQAYDIVYHAVSQATALKIPFIYKKTDSALRGNIGAELSAMLQASGARQLPFLPALPQMNRNTIHGIHYINDKPVAESVFGQDPFEPVTRSSVVELFKLQGSVPVSSYPAPDEQTPLPDEEGVLVFDASSDAELLNAGRCLMQHDMLHVSAGCAGFGAVLSELIGLSGKAPRAIPELEDKLLVLCGSVNPITQAQLRHAEQNGFLRLHMTPHQKLTRDYFLSEEGQSCLHNWEVLLSQNPYCIIDANDAGEGEATLAYAEHHGLDMDDVRMGISGALGQILKQLFDHCELGSLLITGGDTLLQCMNCMQVYEMQPLGELYPGVVLSTFVHRGSRHYVISKSGGFGKETLLTDLVDYIQSTRPERATKEEQTWPIKRCLA